MSAIGRRDLRLSGLVPQGLSEAHETVIVPKPPLSRCPSRKLDCVTSLRLLRPCFVASLSYASPKVALAPAMQALRRAASVAKCARIGERLAHLAVGRPGQGLQ